MNHSYFCSSFLFIRQFLIFLRTNCTLEISSISFSIIIKKILRKYFCAEFSIKENRNIFMINESFKCQRTTSMIFFSVVRIKIREKVYDVVCKHYFIYFSKFDTLTHNFCMMDRLKLLKLESCVLKYNVKRGICFLPVSFRLEK